MTGNKKVHCGVPDENLVRLKPQKLGRHYHRIPAYIRELSSKRSQVISDYFLRTYRIGLELETVVVHEHRAEHAECTYQSPLGLVGFSIDRALLTEALECYYGGKTPASRETAPPVSTSEERMRSRLGSDIANLLARLLLAGETFGELTEYENSYDETSWEYIAEFRYTSHVTGNLSSIFIYLDAQLVDELTHRLAKPQAVQMPASSSSKIEDLPVQLNCVIAAMDLPLAEVLKLRPGNILTLRLLDRCDVEINQEKLFRGVIYEDDGALLLTSLESVKTP